MFERDLPAGPGFRADAIRRASIDATNLQRTNLQRGNGKQGIGQRATRGALQIGGLLAVLAVSAAPAGAQNPAPGQPNQPNTGAPQPGAQQPGAQQPGGQPTPPNPQGQPPQGPANAPQMKIEGDWIVFSMTEGTGMDLKEFIKWTGEVTRKTFVVNDSELMAGGGGATSPINFWGTLRIPRDRLVEDFYTFFQTMLYIKGFALVPRGEGGLEMLEVVSMNGQRLKEVTNGAKYVTVEEIDKYKNQTGVPVLVVVPLKNTNATVATNALRPFFNSAGGPQGTQLMLGNVGNNSAMLLQGFGPQVYAAVKLLQLVDQPTVTTPLVTHVQRLENAAPEELEPILTEILDNRQRARQQQLVEQGQGASGAPLQGSSTNIKIVTNSSQKSLVMSGTQEQIKEALELIARLDLPPDPFDANASVYRLKNVLANDLRTTLRDFVRDDQQAEQAQAQGQPGQAGQARRPRNTVIQAHEESNSLLISASQTKYTQIVALIEELDRRQPQVLIEAALVELTTGDLQRFGVELGLLDIKNSGDFTRGFGFTSFGQSVFQDTDDDGLPDTRLPDFDNPLQGITGGIISGGDFAIPVLLNALATNDRANILSLPSVLVNNNENATVTTEEERPTTQTSQNNTSTQSGVGQPRRAGITLEISPTISPNDYLRLNIKLEVSRFVGQFDPNSVTGGGVTLRRTIQTQVTMPSDDTMVLGGVIEDSEAQSDGGVPFLKDLPLLGFLFRKSESTSNKTNLYFFVTPTILDEPHDFHDLWQLSLQKKMEAEQYIGTRRLQIVDKKWTGAKAGTPMTLEDPGATIEDLDKQGGNEMPKYQRAERVMPQRTKAGAPTGPSTPTGNTAAPGTPPHDPKK